MKKEKKPTVWGIIALVIGVLSLFTPRLFLSMILILLAIFIILGYAKDGSKVTSILATIIFVMILYSELSYTAKSIEKYNVTYVVECTLCEVRYTNETGGTDHEENVSGIWSKHLVFSGSDFIRVQAQNQGEDARIYAKILVNRKKLREEESSGRFAIAGVSGEPKDIDGY